MGHPGGTFGGGRKGAYGAPKGTVGDPRATLWGLWGLLGELVGPKGEEPQWSSELAGRKVGIIIVKSTLG